MMVLVFRGRMRVLAPGLVVVLVGLVVACTPAPQVSPTPTSLKPPNLLTPRPTLVPTATPAPGAMSTARSDEAAPEASSGPAGDVPSQTSGEMEAAVVPEPPAVTPTPVLRG